MQNDPNKPIRLEDLEETALNAGEAFLALGMFLGRYAERVQPEGALAVLCTDVQIANDSMSNDPAALSDWAECVRLVLSDKRKE
jgi:hypothetical protein